PVGAGAAEQPGDRGPQRALCDGVSRTVAEDDVVADLGGADDDAGTVVAAAHVALQVPGHALGEGVGPVGGGEAGVQVDLVDLERAQARPNDGGGGGEPAGRPADLERPGLDRQLLDGLGEAVARGGQVGELFRGGPVGAGLDV